MNQQIAPSVTSQTASTALKTANGQDKPAEKGLFGKLVAMIEGKGKSEQATDSEGTGSHLDETPISNPVTSKVDKAELDLFPIIKTAAQKVKAQQEDTSEAIIANSGLTVSSINYNGNKLLTAIDLAVASAKAEANPAADGKEPFLIVRTNTDQVAKAMAGSEIKQGAANPAANGKEAFLTVMTNADQPVKAGAGSEMKQAAANSAANGKEVFLTAVTNADQPVKAGAGSEMKQAAANSAADGKEPSLAVRTNTDQPVKGGTGSEMKQAAANSAAAGKEVFLTAVTNADQPVKAGAGSEMKQAAANSAADGKEPSLTVRTNTDQVAKAGTESEMKQAATPGQTAGISSVARTEYITSASEQRIAGIEPDKVFSLKMPEQQRFSTNNFMYGYKLNSDNLSKPKVQLLQASADKKSGIPVGNNINPLIQPAAPLASSMKDMILQADTLSRPNHQSLEAPNNQAFQANSLDTTSMFVRSASQPLQFMSSSGPWAVPAAMQQIGQAAGQGKFQMELTLTPAHLGKVRVVLESDANKQIQVHLIIDQPASRQSIEQHLPTLRQALADQGLNMDSFSMESSEQHKDNQQSGQTRNSAADTMTSGVSGSAENQPAATTDSRLSIHV